MSITINIRYAGNNGSARKFAEEMIATGVVGKIRKQPGNLRYEYYSSMDDPETILLVDSWDNQEAIDKHHASPMMQTIIDLREKYNLHMTVERYISNEDLPEEDRKYIRE